jgi:hypothetical protein
MKHAFSKKFATGAAVIAVAAGRAEPDWPPRARQSRPRQEPSIST